MREHINSINDSIFNKIIDTAPESISYFEKMFSFIDMFEPISSITNMSFLDVSDDLKTKFKNLINAHPEYLQYVQDINADYVKNIISLHPEYVTYLTNPSDEILCFALKKDGLILKNIPKNRKTEKICEIAIDQNPESIQYIENDTPSLWLKAIRYNLTLVRYLKDFSPLIWMPIMQNASKAILYFKEITPEMVDIAIEQDPLVIFDLRNRRNIEIPDYSIKKAIKINPKVYKLLADIEKPKFTFIYIVSAIKKFFIKDGD